MESIPQHLRVHVGVLRPDLPPDTFDMPVGGVGLTPFLPYNLQQIITNFILALQLSVSGYHWNIARIYTRFVAR